MIQTANNTAIEPGRLGQVAAKLFLNITEEWGLTDEQRLILAGVSSRSTIANWKRKSMAKEPIHLSRDTLERLSYISGIYKALQILLPLPEQWAQWVHKPNKVFGGQTALDKMLAGNVLDLADVRRYLDAQRGR
ncbi:MbcA/ParS/Xre antitoxin family protein [Algicola sagamiensis]|uniref:MbcA/ParS/Xre antitoxin family protein n=1 Tax=Algicola sagamiensis TaxID=163869 RepID=UPI0003689064|nr:MbcA/ParS/Xre antitoxin family protein [Algicola sagamiensis]